jgi:hypothetical protein
MALMRANLIIVIREHTRSASPGIQTHKITFCENWSGSLLSYARSGSSIPGPPFGPPRNEGGAR